MDTQKILQHMYKELEVLQAQAEMEDNVALIDDIRNLIVEIDILEAEAADVEVTMDNSNLKNKLGAIIIDKNKEKFMVATTGDGHFILVSLYGFDLVEPEDIDEVEFVGMIDQIVD